MVDGIEVACLDGIEESYSEKQTAERYYVFQVNVSAENIADYYLALSAHVSGLAFFLLEYPINESEEVQLRKESSDPFHRAVYYLDGIDSERGQEIFKSYARLLVHDGLVNFGYGAHEGHDEVYVGGYKIFWIYADEPEKYRRALKELGVPRVTELKTVWDTFTEDSPGERNALREKPTAWDMVEELRGQGLYRAEVGED
jgi:hypothetical protein